jgi:hypothetical protein
MENPFLALHAKEFAESLKFTKVVAQPNGDYTVTILRWDADVSDTHLSDLILIPKSPSDPWNAWLGETLMYCAYKSKLHLVKEEIDELIKIANTGDLMPALLKAAAAY